MADIHWTEDGARRSAPWHSENGSPPARRVVVADDRIRAADAYGLVRAGTALLWRGDFHNGRRLLAAVGRRLGRGPRIPAADAGAAFRAQRRHQETRARVLGRILVLLEDDHGSALRRAPDVRRACREAYGPPRGPMAVSLRELLGVLGAHQWRTRGVEVPALGRRVHPHYGVFSPVRGEYVDLVARARPPSAPRSGPATAFDLGTGTGVLAAVLASRGFDRVVATDINPRALACAGENARRLGLARRIEVVGPGLYPDGRAHLVVCNPPWLPARAATLFERGVYDPDEAMLRGFLDGLPAHLEPGGEGWLILSDLAEHLGLRTRDGLLAAIAAAGLRVVGRLDTAPRHPRSCDAADPLHAARSAETTSLWRLTAT
ncbi:methyltransferase [Nocardiopsis trehalosi]|jgi:SAM-dependent methyltransferase|uniref:methyltransferase n=1 Tax=Nocardiopsis trehalosi TaxID=109329 RepID=UPI00082F37B6|nr:class I SAM-dependent methyltransferase [Nocardiopsis trehalosi]